MSDDAADLLASLSASKLFDLMGLVAVVTGGVSGIGLMIATTLIANGATVYIVDLEQDRIDAVVGAYENASGGRLRGLQGDVTQKSEAKRLARRIGEMEKYVNVLFNNAGVPGNSIANPYPSTKVADYVKAFDALDEDDFEGVFAVNSTAPYFLAVAFLKLLDASKRTHFAPQIINTCSLNSFSKDIATSARCVPYQLSKAAVAHLTKVLAHELIPLKIRVNGIAPGLFLTGMTSDEPPTSLGFPPPPAKPFVKDGVEPACEWFKVPAGRPGAHEDVGALALMLVTNGFINGEIVLIDGGSLLRHASTY